MVRWGQPGDQFGLDNADFIWLEVQRVYITLSSLLFFFGNPGLPRESLSGLILGHMTPGGRVKEKGNNFLQLLKEFSCI